MKYYVSVTETLSRVVSVSAGSKEEAIEKAKSAYCENEIVLTGDDYVDDSARIELDGEQEIWEENGGLQHID